jgi:hypothetical protein
VISDGSCNPIASDQLNTHALLGLLADIGGPMLTRALMAGSPAIDAGDNALCPATGQQGVARDAACDVGAFDYVP